MGRQGDYFKVRVKVAFELLGYSGVDFFQRGFQIVKLAGFGQYVSVALGGLGG